MTSLIDLNWRDSDLEDVSHFLGVPELDPTETSLSKFFLKHADTTWSSTKHLQQNLCECLSEDIFIKENRLLSYRQGEKDGSISQIIISTKPHHDHEICKACCLLVLIDETIRNDEHFSRAVNQVHELLSRNCGISKSPFVLMNEDQFCVGIAVWTSYSTLTFLKCKHVHEIYQPPTMNRNERTVSVNALFRLYQILTWEGEWKPNIVQDSFGTKYNLMRLIGLGGACAAYEADIFEHETSDKFRKSSRNTLTKDNAQIVVKFSESSLVLRRDLKIDRLLKPCHRVGWKTGVRESIKDEKINCVLWNDKESYFIVGPLHYPVVRSAFMLQRSLVTLTLEHMKQLLNCLMDLHSNNYVHRDVRLQNILINANGRAILSDFGACFTNGRPDFYVGTVVTAGQRVLKQMIDGVKLFACYFDDDLESLLKVYLIIIEGAVPPDSSQPQDIFEYWMSLHRVADFLSLSSLTDKILYLKKLFTPVDREACMELLKKIPKIEKLDPSLLRD